MNEELADTMEYPSYAKFVPVACIAVTAVVAVVVYKTGSKIGQAIANHREAKEFKNQLRRIES